MNIGSLTNSVNNLAEETFSSSQILEFANDCLARINIVCNANFPFFNSSDPSDYTALPEKWQRALFIPFVVGRMKQVDASQFEYTDQFGEFSANLVLFKERYTIPDAYKDTAEGNRFDDDFSSNPWYWGNSRWNSDDPLGG